MTITTMQIRTIVGVVGNFISFGLFISPCPTIWRIYKNKSVEEFSPMPYIACVMNCLLWIFYGLPFNHPNSTLVITINGVGLVLELVYLTVFFVYGNKNRIRLKIIGFLLGELILLGGIASLDLIKYHTHEARSTLVGILCIVFGIIMYGSPLTIMHKVVTTKSVEFMPFYLSLAGFLNGVCWTGYALLQFDLFILIANGVGGLLGLSQLILYAIYYGSTPKKTKKGATNVEVQLEKVTVSA